MGLDVKVRDGESQDSLLRRFQRSVQMEGVLREAKTHQHFVSRGDAARIKQRANARRKRRQKQM